MSKQEISESVGLARDRLNELRSRLEELDQGAGSREIVIALSDLEELLQKLHARYGLSLQILDHTNDMVCAKDRNGCYVMINPRGAGMFGKTMAAVLGANDRALLVPADAERIMAVDREVMRTGMPRARDETLALSAGSRVLITTTNAWYDAEQNVRGVIGIAQDVTEHRRRQREVEHRDGRMRSMAAEIVIGEERLRRSLAAELHSGLGQYIALAKLKLTMLRGSASADLHEALRGIEQLVEHADRSLRSVTLQISPHSLHDLGLVPALQWLAEDLGGRYGLEVRLDSDDALAVTDERVRVILFRAVRELLVNVSTHAHVGAAVVSLARDGALVRITVQDDGTGFDIADLDRHGHGLLGIREQLKFVGGMLQIESVPGSGTTVTLTAPASGPPTVAARVPS